MSSTLVTGSNDKKTGTLNKIHLEPVLTFKYYFIQNSILFYPAGTYSYIFIDFLVVILCNLFM